MEPGYTLRQYVIVRKLGDGGMGEVWSGKHATLDYDVAIKFLKPRFADDAELQERFLNEGKRQAQLDHPNIVRAIDFITEDGRAFLVMRLVDGVGLDARIEQAGGAFPTDEALDIAYQVLSGLDYAHRAGVVHRDVKPSNILVDSAGKCYLTDFGIALAVWQRRVTRTGTVMGTATYMSPEQIRAPHAVDGRSDIYSFGVVMFEMLTGVPPFDAEGGNEFLVKQAHVEQPPPKLTTLNPAVGKAIEAVVLRALAKQPEDRWPTCEAMISALEIAAQEKRPPLRRSHPTGTTAPPIPPPGFEGRGTHGLSRHSGHHQIRANSSVPEENWITRNRGWLSAAVVLLAVLVGLRAAGYLGRVPRPSTAEGSPSQPAVEIPAAVEAAPRGTPAPDKPPTDNSVSPPTAELAVTPSAEPSEPANGNERASAPAVRRKPPLSERSVAPAQERDTSAQGTRLSQRDPKSEVVAPTEQARMPIVAERDTNGARGVVEPPPRIESSNVRPPLGVAPSNQERAVRLSGTINWEIELKKNRIESLTETWASTGRISGEPFPGVPVSVSISPPGVAGVVESPSPSNGWKTLRLRSLVKSKIIISIQWKRL